MVHSFVITEVFFVKDKMRIPGSIQIVTQIIYDDKTTKCKFTFPIEHIPYKILQFTDPKKMGKQYCTRKFEPSTSHFEIHKPCKL